LDVLQGSRHRGLSESVLEAIGDTPLIEVEEGIYAKLEYLNPSGSIKARIAKYIVEKAEREGLLLPGHTIVEATSGNTGNAFSMVAAIKGYRMVVLMPEGLSTERVAISRAFGAHIEHVGEFYVTEALKRARELGKKEGYFCPAQFDSEWNVEENREWLGKEILGQLEEGGVGAPDALVMGVGTGGTLIGVGQAFREKNAEAKLIAVEPEESCTLLCGESGVHKIEGISDGFVPGIYERHAERLGVDEVYAVGSEEALGAMRWLARRRGLFVGPSSGANLVAARRLKEAHPELKSIVTLFCDEGEKYISEHFAGEGRPLETGERA